MKVTYGYYGSLELEAEDDRDQLWLAQFVENWPLEMRKPLERHVSIDLEDMFKLDKDRDAKEITIDECVDKKYQRVWGRIEKIEIHPLGM